MSVKATGTSGFVSQNNRQLRATNDIKNMLKYSFFVNQVTSNTRCRSCPPPPDFAEVRKIIQFSKPIDKDPLEENSSGPQGPSIDPAPLKDVVRRVSFVENNKFPATSSATSLKTTFVRKSSSCSVEKGEEASLKTSKMPLLISRQLKVIPALKLPIRQNEEEHREEKRKPIEEKKDSENVFSSFAKFFKPKIGIQQEPLRREKSVLEIPLHVSDLPVYVAKRGQTPSRKLFS